MQHDGSRRKAMGFMPMVRSQNTSAAVPGNRTESFSPVLSKVQKGKHYQCKELYRFMMAIMVKTAGKGLAAKENRTQGSNAGYRYDKLSFIHCNNVW